MIIDAHAHITQLNGKYWGVQDLLQSMDEAGIDMSLVIAGEFVGESTEKILDLCNKEKRIRIIGDITYTKLSDVYLVRRFEQIKTEQIIGIKFYPGYQDFYPYDKKLFPVYKYCEQTHTPIVFHMGVLEVGYEGNGEQTHPKHIDTVAKSFPNLKIVIAHLGNPWIEDTARLVKMYPHVYTDVSAYFTEYQKIVEQEKVEFLQAMKSFKSIAGNFTKCLFGTDWPLYDQKDYLQVVQQIPMTFEEKELIYWKNAKKIFTL